MRVVLLAECRVYEVDGERNIDAFLAAANLPGI
jgi:hypothetical protein